MAGTLYITGEAAADELLNSDPNALLLGMLLDQQVPMEWAFRGPAHAEGSARTRRPRQDRSDGPRRVRVDLLREAGDSPLSGVHGQAHPPGVHGARRGLRRRRCPPLGRRAIRSRGVFARLTALPGYGDEKAKIFVALLGKTQGVEPDGWREAAGKFGDDVPRSVADVYDEVSLGKVRDWKRAQKAAKKDKQDRPVG